MIIKLIILKKKHFECQNIIFGLDAKYVIDVMNVCNYYSYCYCKGFYD